MKIKFGDIELDANPPMVVIINAIVLYADYYKVPIKFNQVLFDTLNLSTKGWSESQINRFVYLIHRDYDELSRARIRLVTRNQDELQINFNPYREIIKFE